VEKQRGSIQAGLAADLVLVDGAPQTDIHDIYKIARVWLDGREVDRAAAQRAIVAPGPTPLPARTATALLDDFEGAGGRSRIDTLWMNATDSGHDHARMIYLRREREDGGHALSVEIEMGEKDRSFGSMVLPLSPGGVEPVDARRFQGVEFEVRGAGEYGLLWHSRAARPLATDASKFSAVPQWRQVRVPITPDAADLTALEFRISRPAREKAWLEIDNVRFYP
jgi:hypothetical protein